MSLRPDRGMGLIDEVGFFCDQVTSALNDNKCERGGVMVVSTVGSGVALDDGAAKCVYAADPSGAVPLGVLTQDVVNYDLTTRTRNEHRQEVQAGGKVTLVNKDWIVTNWIFPGVTPAAGDKAYLTQSGYITPTQGTSDNTPLIGSFRTIKDEDGFARVFIDV